MFSLLHLPRELILLIYGYLPETDLIKLCEVSSLSKRLALLAILAQYGISESQLHSQELSKVPPRALRALIHCYPAIISNILALDAHFNRGDVVDFHMWRYLGRLAECFPIIPCITLTFSEEPTASEILSDLWNVLPTTLIALMGNNSRPVVVVHSAALIAVRPRLPNILKRAWRTSTGSSSLPVVDNRKLIHKLQQSMATVTTHRVLSSIQVRSFVQPGTPLGSLVVLNPGSIYHLTINPDVISPSEWQCVLSDLHLPYLRTLFVGIDLECHSLSAFLDTHSRIEYLELTTDWSCLHGHTLRPISISALPRLKHISAGARVIARVLQTPNDFPLLDYVCINAHDFTANDADSPRYYEAALRAVAPRASVANLMVQIHGVEVPPWMTLDVKDPGVEQELRYIQELHILPWTLRAECDTFPLWLARFPALKKLTIAGNLFQPSRGPLLSHWLAEAIKSTCPYVIVKQERRIG
ncbi:hypothetical protein DFH09DRAFT_53715 [Mycena vulgaris]|nr:hypothetical protein DFH09DRAFT_53715 [Mycena vulgaris]